MSALYAVLLRDAACLDVAVAAAIYSDVMAIPRADASLRMRVCGGVIHEAVGADEAARLAAGLSSSGMPAVTIPAEDLVEFPPAEMCHQGRIDDDGFILEQTGPVAHGRVLKRFRIQGRNIMLLVAGMVRERERQETVEHEREPVSGRQNRGLFAYRPKTVTKYREVYRYYLDVCAIEPATHCRIEAGQFGFLSFGLAVATTSFLNLARLTAWIASIAGEAYVDKSIRYVIDGDPKTNPRAPSLQAYENYVFWATQMAYLRAQ